MGKERGGSASLHARIFSYGIEPARWLKANEPIFVRGGVQNAQMGADSVIFPLWLALIASSHTWVSSALSISRSRYGKIRSRNARICSCVMVLLRHRGAIVLCLWFYRQDSRLCFREFLTRQRRPRFRQTAAALIQRACTMRWLEYCCYWTGCRSTLPRRGPEFWLLG